MKEGKTKECIVLTGFMGVGKSTVARHLSGILRCQRVDLDHFIEQKERRRIAEIIEADGEKAYRIIETRNLKNLLETSKARIISLGGGAWTIRENRDLIRERGLTTVWLESTFEHCWLNIKYSRKFRPLAQDKKTAKRLFDERNKVYCLADWHFIIRPDLTSAQIAEQIANEVCMKFVD